MEERECADCGEPMKLREGEYGPFWGCTDYPECRHTEKADEEDEEGFDLNDIEYNS